MKHFLDISQLSVTQIEGLLSKAFELKKTRHFPSYPHRVLAHFFYENSTRTRVSFELAALNLDIKVINLEMQHSSEAKGEHLEDSVKNLAAMGIQYFVIRHSQNYIQEQLAERLQDEALHLINAGDGTHAHPSQALLDMMTIIEQKPKLSHLKVAIVGNVKHSRVANSFQLISAKMGLGELVLVAPEIWQPEKVHYGRVSSSLEEGLDGADVVMCLRVQRERLQQSEHLNLDEYRAHYALTKQALALAKPDAMVMHPGPMNRGIEIDSDVADGSQSFILTQVQNGIFARMAILDSLD
jgi:aspartate carbamoyltransferase catalytic subunit